MVARCPQRVHSSRWPPSAAVRHRAMASNTLTCFQLSQWRFRSRKAASCDADEIGHLEGRPAHLLLLRGPAFQFQRVQRARGCLEVTLRKMQVNGGLFEIAMA